jgi:hypothetical protein
MTYELNLWCAHVLWHMITHEQVGHAVLMPETVFFCVVCVVQTAKSIKEVFILFVLNVILSIIILISWEEQGTDIPDYRLLPWCC